MSTTIADLYNQYYYLLDNDAFNTHAKATFNKIAGKTADNAEMENSLLRLTKMLSTHYGKPVILLIDEYDVPLAKANQGAIQEKR